MIRASINGVEGNFMFDTGAGITLITKTFSSKINNFYKQDGGYTGFRETGEKVDADMYKANTLSIGGFVEKDPVFTVFDLDFGPVDGIISLKSLAGRPFTIDYEKREMIFETQKSLNAIKKRGRIVQLQLDASRDKSLDIFAYFMVDKKLALQFLIDSGAGANVFIVNAKYIPALNIDTAKAKKVYHPSEFNPKLKTTIYVSSLQSITTKDDPSINCNNVKASFISGLIYDGAVSLNWIGKRITFDLNKPEMIVQ